jgi:predicted RNA-binding Zn-ribbon protein involved in translation (DUF1610 family)
MAEKTLRCPKCGAAMNRHAEKPVNNPDVPEGEIIIIIYCCPHCGKVEAEIAV